MGTFLGAGLVRLIPYGLTLILMAWEQEQTEQVTHTVHW
jgi:hypothetical protein